ncbi:hypothetical protein EVAR_67768_1 [Eumeta japonica]|uniref:Uncharacterized protein n=1 Tax=Eumeta variegata TaxID=151549 RepID=A0A4C1ZH98_EUMVA|nr:hypothetical protein EVAR_67768_1 [Eumeta japonica]
MRPDCQEHAPAGPLNAHVGPNTQVKAHSKQIPASVRRATPSGAGARRRIRTKSVSPPNRTDAGLPRRPGVRRLHPEARVSVNYDGVIPPQSGAGGPRAATQDVEVCKRVSCEGCVPDPLENTCNPTSASQNWYATEDPRGADSLE